MLLFRVITLIRVINSFLKQVYSFSRKSDGKTFAVTKLSSNIPVNLPPNQFSLDGVKFVSTPNTNKTHLFVRSQSNTSQIYYSYQDWKTGAWSKYTPIGDNKHYLAYDFDVVLNTFVWVSLHNLIIIFVYCMVLVPRLLLFM